MVVLVAIWVGVCTLIAGVTALVTRFMGPTRGPSGADRTQKGPMLAPWTLLSGGLPHDLPERTWGRPWGRLRVRIRSIDKKRQVGSFILLHKISRTACCFGIRTFLKQYNCYESATNWYTDHQYLAQYSDIINNLQEIPLIFCNYAVRSCGTWRKGPGQSPCNGLSISDLELYVTETSTGVCDPVTD